MPIVLDIWKVDDRLTKLTPLAMDREDRLETMIEEDPSIIDPNIIIIGRQVPTAFGGFIDLLAINADGELIAIELKKHRTTRDVTAQVLDYGVWVRDLDHDTIRGIYRDTYSEDLEVGFDRKFGDILPETLNENYKLLIVASTIDARTDRLLTYLAEEFDVPINAVLFQYFKDGDREYLTRIWLIDPRDADTATSRTSSKRKIREEWNGTDYYIALGDGKHRSWEDCRMFNFIAAGQGEPYGLKLKKLHEGDRVFVHIPQKGYVGVGWVREGAKRVKDVRIEHNGEMKRLLDLPLEAKRMDENADDEEKSEYVVMIDWIKAVPKEEAFWIKGMFANQNIVCKLRNKYTLDQLYRHFKITKEA